MPVLLICVGLGFVVLYESGFLGGSTNVAPGVPQPTAGGSTGSQRTTGGDGPAPSTNNTSNLASIGSLSGATGIIQPVTSAPVVVGPPTEVLPGGALPTATAAADPNGYVVPPGPTRPPPNTPDPPPDVPVTTGANLPSSSQAASGRPGYKTTTVGALKPGALPTVGGTGVFVNPDGSYAYVKTSGGQKGKGGGGVPSSGNSTGGDAEHAGKVFV